MKHNASSERRLRWGARLILYPVALGLIALAWHQRQAGAQHASVTAPSFRTPSPVAPEWSSNAESSAGCQAATDEPSTPIRHRAVATPSGPVPFFAARAGVLPDDGVATVGGVRLPRGSRCPHYWATDAPVHDAVALASRLAAAFPKTGLWPVLWDASDDPDGYASSGGDPHDADRLNVPAILAEAWKGLGTSTAFPGLALGTYAPSIRRPDPFRQLAASGDLGSPVGQVILLVPVNRPADAVIMLGFVRSEFSPDPVITAVARSWEERFGAVVTTIGPGSVGLAVGRPPSSQAQALALANEQNAFDPDQEDADGTALARELLAGRTRYFWVFGWPD